MRAAAAIDISAPAILDHQECGRPSCTCHASARRGKGNTHCPAHDDRSPSLSVDTGADGKPLVHCLSGCTQDEVISALRALDLWPSSNGRKPSKITPIREVARYDFVSTEGGLLATHCRRDLSNGDKRVWWEPKGVQPATLPLYRLADVLTAPPDTPITLHEGEKCADVAHTLGYVAVSLAGGASQTDFGTALAPLAGRDVYLFPDNDTPGRALMQRVGKALTGLARSIHWVTLPGLPDKGDIADWRQAGGDGATLLDPAYVTPFEATEPEQPSFARTDAGNGELFAFLHGDAVKFDHRRDRYLVWAGQWWAEDITEIVTQMAKDAARWRYRAAEHIDDAEKKHAEAKWAIASESRGRIEATLAQARSEPPIANAGNGWDANGDLLGAANGVVETRTGTFRQGKQADMITMNTGIPYTQGAQCPRWLRFLDEVFADDTELIDFVWRSIGYSLTGDISEQCLFVCHGSGANGKSVFLAILRALLGNYAYNAPFTTFEMTSRASIPNDLAALADKRLVTAAETSENTRLNEARLKALTGGDPITARFLYHEAFTFEPVCKIWLAVNHLPRVQDDSVGFWRRVRLIPFTQHFEDPEKATGTVRHKADKGVLKALRGELPGILAWAIAGCLEWQRRGLNPPAAVKVATAAYQADEDPLAQFLVDTCVVAESCWVASGKLYEAYRHWADEQGLSEKERKTANAFGRAMSERFEAVRRGIKGERGYRGVGLRTLTENASVLPNPPAKKSLGDFSGTDGKCVSVSGNAPDSCVTCGAVAVGYTPDSFAACEKHLNGGAKW